MVYWFTMKIFFVIHISFVMCSYWRNREKEYLRYFTPSAWSFWCGVKKEIKEWEDKMNGEIATLKQEILSNKAIIEKREIEIVEKNEEIIQIKLSLTDRLESISKLEGELGKKNLEIERLGQINQELMKKLEYKERADEKVIKMFGQVEPLMVGMPANLKFFEELILELVEKISQLNFSNQAKQSQNDELFELLKELKVKISECKSMMATRKSQINSNDSLNKHWM
jgi:hypothetical protein